MPDYELLELVLFRGHSAARHQGLGQAPAARFGSFTEVTNTPAERIKEVRVPGERAASKLALMRAVAMRLMRTDLMQCPALASASQVIDYVRAAQAYESHEVFRVLYLDKKNKILADEIQGKGTGDPTPSRADIDMTKLIIDAADPFSIAMHVHIIVGRDGHARFRALRPI